MLKLPCIEFSCCWWWTVRYIIKLSSNSYWCLCKTIEIESLTSIFHSIRSTRTRVTTKNALALAKKLKKSHNRRNNLTNECSLLGTGNLTLFILPACVWSGFWSWSTYRFETVGIWKVIPSSWRFVSCMNILWLNCTTQWAAFVPPKKYK